MDKSIALGANWDPDLIARLQEILPNWTIISNATMEAARTVDVLIPFGMAVNRNLLSGSRIKLVQQFGVGLDNIDLEAAQELGIAVTNAPSKQTGMAGTVAEGAVLLALSCSRLPSLRHAKLAQSRWNWTSPLNYALSGKTAGIVGFGSIGQGIGHRLSAFGMRIIGVRRSPDKYKNLNSEVDWIRGFESLSNLMNESDIVLVSMPCSPDTEGLFGEQLFKAMKQNASFINVSRGKLVNEPDLIYALDHGQLHAAGLDTICTEPPAANSPLLTHDRIIITPHDAGVSDVAFNGVTSIIADNLARLETGNMLKYQVA